MELLRLVFGQGWWSVGFVLTFAIGLGVPYCLVRYTGDAESRRTALALALGFAGPAVAVVYVQALLIAADPQPGCTEECWGRLGRATLGLLGLIAWRSA